MPSTKIYKMKASELRIGNWVHTIDGAKQVIELHYSENYPKGISHHVTDNVRVSGLFLGPIGGVLPIPLTEEWLLKLGFEKTEDLGDMIYYELKGSGARRYTICNNHDEWQFSLTVRDEYTTIIYDEPFFQCVHHLQNLYFALTGTEL